MRALTGKTSSTASSSATAASDDGGVRPAPSRSILLTAQITGAPASSRARAPRIALAMKRSPGPTPCSPLTTKRTASASASSCSTRRCMRWVRRSRGRCTPGRSISTICQPASGSVAMPAGGAARRLRAVGDDRDLGADDRVDQGRLADVRAAGEPDEPRPQRHASPAITRAWSSSISPESVLVVVAAEVKHAVDGRLDDILGVLGADHDVAKLARAGDVAGAVDRERQDVGGLVLAPVLAVQLGDPLRADELDRQVAVAHAGRARAPRETASRRSPRHVGEVDQGLGLPSRSAYSP